MKNSMKKCICRILAFGIALLAWSGTPAKVSAAEVTTGPMVVIDSYEVTNEKVVPGEDFSLTLQLKNYNKREAAKEVLLDISNPDGVAPVYGTVSQVYVGDIGPGESREITIDYNSWTSITGDTLDFYVTVVTSVNQNYIVLRVPAGSDSPFSILGSNIPAEVGVNELANISLTFKVLGDENVGNVALTLNYNGEPISRSQIGALTPGTTKTQRLSTYFAQAGDYPLDLGLEYVDDAGQTQTDIVMSTTISVVEKHDATTNNDSYNGNAIAENGADNLLLLGVSGIVILGIFLAVIVLLKKNK